MKTQHQYAAETHPDLGDGEDPTWGNTRRLCKPRQCLVLNIIMKESEYFMIKVMNF